ncbi:hypothetical protein ACRAWF_27640 [Streptomyces sp. L7]
MDGSAPSVELAATADLQLQQLKVRAVARLEQIVRDRAAPRSM